MSSPASARVIKLANVESIDVGEKIRTYGYLFLAKDPSSALAVITDLRPNKGGRSRGLLIDLSICLDPLEPESSVFREEGSFVMVMGSIEELQAEELSRVESETFKKRLDVDTSTILRAILVKEANDVNVTSLEKILDTRREFESQV